MNFFSVTPILSYRNEYNGAKEYMRFKVLFHVLQALLLLKFFRVTLEMSKSITFWSDMVKIFKNRPSDGESQGLYYHLEAYTLLKVTFESKFWVPKSFAFQ